MVQLDIYQIAATPAPSAWARVRSQVAWFIFESGINGLEVFFTLLLVVAQFFVGGATPLLPDLAGWRAAALTVAALPFGGFIACVMEREKISLGLRRFGALGQVVFFNALAGRLSAEILPTGRLLPAVFVTLGVGAMFAYWRLRRLIPSEPAC